MNHEIYGYIKDLHSTAEISVISYLNNFSQAYLTMEYMIYVHLYKQAKIVFCAPSL